MVKIATLRTGGGKGRTIIGATGNANACPYSKSLPLTKSINWGHWGFQRMSLLKPASLDKVHFRKSRRRHFQIMSLVKNGFLLARNILENRATEMFKPRHWPTPLPFDNVHFRKLRQRIVQIVSCQHRFLWTKSILESRDAELFKSRPLSKTLPLGKLHFRKSRHIIVQTLSLVNIASFGQNQF